MLNPLNILKVTENAALAASYHIGKKDKIAADNAATISMRETLNSLKNFSAKVKIGEGKKDNAPGLFADELIGKEPYEFEIAVDPIDGTTQVANNGYGAMSLIAIANKLYHTEEHYMLKMSYGNRIKKLNEQKYNLNTDLKDFANAFPGLTVCLLDRPRHEEFIEIFKNANWKIKLIKDCDVAGALSTVLLDDVDLYYGIGGSPEGVITACAFHALQYGHFEFKLLNDNNVLTSDDVVCGDSCFSATGITDGELLFGIYNDSRIINSLVINDGIVRWIDRKRLAYCTK